MQLNSRMKKIKLFLVLGIFFSVALSFASSPKIKIYRDHSDFKAGEKKQIALTKSGSLTLSNEIETFFDAGEPYLWCWTEDSLGNIYVGTGNDGKVYKISSKGESSVFFDADELEIYALAADQKNYIYAATAPEGKIYRISSQGNSQIYYDPPDKYIWDLAFDAKGNLLAATGDSCRIYRISGAGKAKLIFESSESHIQVLHLEQSGRIIAGSVDNGYIYQITPDGKSSVLFDSGFREVHSIAVDPAGNIYAGVYGRKQVPRIPMIPPGKSTEKSKNQTENEGQAPKELPEIQIIADAPTPASRSDRQKSAIFKLTPEGAQQNIWHLKDAVYSIVLNKDGSLFVGTGGNRGKLFQLNRDEEETLLLEVDDAQITALYRDKTNHIFMCTSNMGKVFKISQTYEKEGVYIAPVFNAQIVSNWGIIRWEADQPANTSIEFFTRSGNTAEANHTWNDWVGPYTQAAGEKIKSPTAQYLQWKAIFKTTAGRHSAVLKQVAFSRMEQNLAPQIKRLHINDPATVVEQPDQLFEDFQQEKSNGGNHSQLTSPLIDSRAAKNRMLRTVRWGCEDENQDALQFHLFYKALKEPNWKALSEDLKYQYLYRWNSQKWADGEYHIKLVVDDALSNPPSIVKSAEKISQPFKVDNTGPVVKQFKFQQHQTKAPGFQFTCEDQMNAIFHVEYAIDNNEWSLLFPVDGINDSSKESFQLKSTSLSKGSHTLVVRVFDRYLNVGFGKFHFTLE